jgi:hypothetical protein
LDGARVNPGPHRIGASAPGYGTERVDIIVGEGQRPTVSVTLVAAPEPTETARPGSVSSTKPDASVSLPGPIMTPDAATPPSQSGSEEHRASVAQVAGMGLGAAGVAVLATAGYFALRTQALVHEAEKSCHTDGTCEQAGLDKLDEARTAQTTGLVLGGAGAALLGTGLVLVLAAGTRGSKGALFVAPSVGSFGLRAGGVF